MRWASFVCAIGIAYAAIDSDLPSPAPLVRATFPHGATRGATTEIELTGDNLHDATGVRFAGRGVDARILSAFGGKLKLAVTVSNDAEAGRRDYRLVTPRGEYEGVFDIGTLPEIREIEPNDDWRKAGLLPLPVLANGTLGNEDWDHFRFHAAAGETLVFDVSATRHGSRLDADIALLDAKGRELAWVDDTTIFGDPHLEHTFQTEGDYYVRVGSLTGGGDYRLSAGRLPYVRRALPAGAGIGQTALLTLRGTHLDLVDAVWVGDRVATGQILKKTPTEMSVRLRVPAGVRPGRYWLHAAQKGREIPMATEFRISAFPEKTIAAEPLTMAAALSVSPSMVLNGAIETPKAMHYYRFTANAGDTYTFRSESMKLGYHLDPSLSLYDAAGKKLAYADDPGNDDRADEYQIDVDLSHRFEKTGAYYIGIRDGMYRGGEQLLYRLTVEKMAPDYILELREPLKSVYQGQQSTVQVRVRRRAGWNVPVEVWAEGLPAGVTVEKQAAAPKDSVVKDTCGVDRTIDGTIVLLPLRVAEDAAPGSFHFVVKARGGEVEHAAIARYENLTAGYTYGPMEIQESRLTVTRPPAVLLTAPAAIIATPGKPHKIKIGIRRFGAAKKADLQIRAAGLPPGAVIEPVTAATGAKEVELILTTATPFANGNLTFEAAAAGEVIGRAAPSALTVQPGSSARR
ncbi:MAG TPA: PPC domain-containing protein [Bryobacteraceae bacterium]|nr:PPC domain-containing protein [Bryobacteraceae bacterium]